MNSNIFDNFFKRTDEMLGSIFGRMARNDESLERIEKKLGDLEERFNTLEENSGSKPPLSQVGPTISDQDEEEYTRIFKTRLPGKITEYLTVPDEIYKEEPLPITHEVVCNHLYCNLHLTL